MDNPRYKYLSLIFTLLGSIIFVWIFYGEILKAPNEYMFSTSGDGLKNYFTYAWHIKHDTSAVNFEGMNYPYGEHFLYTDCHPVFTLVFRSLKPIFPGIVDYSVGFLNFLLIFSFVLTALCLWLVFKELKVNPFLSIVASLGIMMLAPQVFRLTGHLALSYSFFIPLTIYFTLRYFKEPQRKKWLWLQMVNVLFWFFTHAYLGMMVAAFLLAWWVVDWVKTFSMDKQKLSKYLPLLFWVVVPIVFFLVFLKTTDIHENRTPHPLGFFNSNAEPDDLLIPPMGPLRSVWNALVSGINLNWEAWSYIGFTSILVLLFLMGRFLFFGFNKKKLELKLINHNQFINAFLAGLILLIFSFGQPFKFYPPMLDWFPVIKNFRATGRFAWFFYFLTTILSVLVLDAYWRKYKSKLVWILAFLMVGFIGFEGMSYHQYQSKEINRDKNLFDVQQLDPEMVKLIRSINPDDFQAILPLPFYHIGSEQFSILEPGQSQTNSMVFAFHTGLPLMSARLTRVGIDESKNLIQVLSPDYYEKKIEQDLNQKNILVLYAGMPLSKYQSSVLNKSEIISKSGNISIYSLNPARLFQNSAKRIISDFENSMNSFFNKSFVVTDSTSFVYFNHFNDKTSDIVFSLPGAYKGKKSDLNLIAGFNGGTFEAGKTYTASLWMYNAHLDALNHWFRLIAEEYDEENDKYYQHWVLPEQSEVINGDWSLVEIDFQLNDPKNYFALKLVGKKIDRATFICDDLLIREKGVDVYKVLDMESGELLIMFRNNHMIMKEW